MKNVYEKCPILENDNYVIRLMEVGDAPDLLKVYSDKRALPYFNSDGCNGDNFYCQSLDNIKEAIKFWLMEYDNGGFVRFSVVDKHTGEAIGSFEMFHRNSEDHFNNTCMMRLDLRYDYEEEQRIYDIISVIVPEAYELFNCKIIATKAPVYAIDRRAALKNYGFTASSDKLIGHDGTQYSDYWVCEQ